MTRVDLTTVEARIVNSLGSTRNQDVFVIAINQLNCFKKNVSMRLKGSVVKN